MRTAVSVFNRRKNLFESSSQVWLTILFLGLMCVVQFVGQTAKADQDLVPRFMLYSPDYDLEEKFWRILVDIETSHGEIRILEERSVSPGESIKKKRVIVVPKAEAICLPMPKPPRRKTFENIGSGIYFGLQVSACESKECQLKVALLARDILIEAIVESDQRLKSCQAKPVADRGCIDQENHLKLTRQLLKQSISEAISNFMQNVQTSFAGLKSGTVKLLGVESNIRQFDLQKTHECTWSIHGPLQQTPLIDRDSFTEY